MIMFIFGLKSAIITVEELLSERVRFGATIGIKATSNSFGAFSISRTLINFIYYYIRQLGNYEELLKNTQRGKVYSARIDLLGLSAPPQKQLFRLDWSNRTHPPQTCGASRDNVRE